MAGKKVVPDTSEQPSDSPKLRNLEEEYPKVFTACVVTVMAAPVGPESLPLNRQSLVEEHTKDPSLGYALKMATCVREAREVHTGYFVRDGILFRKWRPAAWPANEEWTVCEQVVLPRS